MDPGCMQSLKLIMTRREGGGQNERKNKSPVAIGMALSDPRCRQSLKLIMTRREGGGRKENKKQKPCSNVGTALSDPRCRQSRTRNEADTLLLAHCHTAGLADEEDDQLGEVLIFRS